MEAEFWLLFGSTAFAAIAAGVSAYSSYLLRQQTRHQMGQDFQERFTPLNDRMTAVLGAPADGIEPPEFRRLVIHFVALYAQVYRGYRLGLFPSEQWEGLRAGFAYWMRRPEVAAAWEELGRQEDAWPDGFVRFVRGEMTGKAASAESLFSVAAPADPMLARHRRDIEQSSAE